MYATVDDDPATQEDIDKLIATQFDDCYSSYADVLAAVGRPPVLSKLNRITKTISATVTKRRLILDCLTSGTNGESAQRERVVLPLVTDVVHDTLRMMKLQRRGKLIQHCVLEFTDAFSRVPFHPGERSYFVALYKNKFLVWNRVAQGSKNRPQAWGRMSALISRLAQALFAASELQLHT